MNRFCKGCNQTKIIEHFYSTGTSKKTGESIYRHKCKECMNNNVKRWSKNNPESHFQICLKWRNKNKEHYNEYRRLWEYENYDPIKRFTINQTYYWK